MIKFIFLIPRCMRSILDTTNGGTSCECGTSLQTSPACTSRTRPPSTTTMIRWGTSLQTSPAYTSRTRPPSTTTMIRWGTSLQTSPTCTSRTRPPSTTTLIRWGISLQNSPAYTSRTRPLSATMFYHDKVRTPYCYTSYCTTMIRWGKPSTTTVLLLLQVLLWSDEGLLLYCLETITTTLIISKVTNITARLPCPPAKIIPTQNVADFSLKLMQR